MKVNLVQYSPVWEDKTENIKILRGMIDEKCKDSLIIFPEMTLTGFTMKASQFAEGLNGLSFSFFSEMAVKYNSEILAGIIENQEGKYFNTLLSINRKGELKSAYRKIHPFSYSSEDKHYSRGENPVIAEIMGFKTGLSVCYDLRFPELYRVYGKERVSLIVNIANWPDTRIDHWRTLLKARAIENQCYVAGVNRTGRDPKLNYPGFSSIFDPMGKELITLDTEEGIVGAEINKDYVDEVRNKLPFLRDMVLI